jgi:hypothetical protein
MQCSGEAFVTIDVLKHFRQLAISVRTSFSVIVMIILLC